MFSSHCACCPKTAARHCPEPPNCDARCGRKRRALAWYESALAHRSPLIPACSLAMPRSCSSVPRMGVRARAPQPRMQLGDAAELLQRAQDGGQALPAALAARDAQVGAHLRRRTRQLRAAGARQAVRRLQVCFHRRDLPGLCGLGTVTVIGFLSGCAACRSASTDATCRCLMGLAL